MYILSDKIILFFLAFFCSIDRLLMAEGFVKPIYVVSFLSLILLIKVVINGNIKVKKHLMIAYIALIVWIFASNVWAKVVFVNITLVTVFVISLAFILVCKSLDEKELHFIRLAFLLGGLIVCINVLTSNQYLNDFEGRLVLAGISEGGANDPNWVSWLLLPSLFVSIRYTSSQKLMHRFLGYFCMIIIFYSIVLSASRGAILAIIVSILCKWIYERKYITTFFSLSILMLIGVFFMDYVTALLGHRFDITFMVETGGAGRMDIWKVALEMIKDNFMLGVGVGNFNSYWQFYAGEAGIGLSRGAERVAHNFLLQCFSELGFMGMMLFLCVVYFSFRKNISSLLVNNEDFVWGGLSLVIGAMFLNAFNEKMFWLFIGIVGSFRIGKNYC